MTGGRGDRPPRSSGKFAPIALGVYGLVAVVLPLLALIIVAFQVPYTRGVHLSAITFDNVRSVLHTPNVVDAVRNSFAYALITVLITLPLSYVAARSIASHRHNRALGRLQEVLINLPLGIPTVIFGIGFLLTYTDSPLHLYGKSWGLIVLYVVLMLPFATRLLLTALAASGNSLSEAGAACGAGVLRRIITIDIPLLRPALAAASALIIVLTSNEFSASILIRSSDTPILGPVMYDLVADGTTSATAVVGLLMCVVTGTGVLVAIAAGGSGALRLIGGSGG